MFVLIYVAVSLSVAAPAPLPRPQPSALLKVREYNAKDSRDTRYLQEEVNLFHDEAILGSVLRTPDLLPLWETKSAREQLRWLRENLTIDSDAKQGTIQVRFQRGTYREQTLIVNALVKTQRRFSIDRIRRPFLATIEQETRRLIDCDRKKARCRAELLVETNADGKDILKALLISSDAEMRMSSVLISEYHKQLRQPHRTQIVALARERR